MKLVETTRLSQGARTARLLIDGGLLKGPLEVSAFLADIASRESPRPLAPSILEPWSAWLEEMEVPGAVRQRLEESRRGTWMVVTGQQAGMFLGPLYTAYKAAGAIALARSLEHHLGEPVLPVFWIADDDHDLGEVQHTSLLDTQGQLRRLRVPLDPTRAPVCSIRVPPAASTLVDQLLEWTGSTPDERFLPAFTPRVGESWTRWFVRALMSVFGDQGLIPIVPSLTTAPARDLFAQALDDPARYSRLLSTGAQNVRALGLEPPLIPDDDPPVFQLGLDDRTRIRAADLGDDRDSPERRSLMTLARREAPRLSANASLRVLIQNALLPVAAYIAGPAELRYWAELGPLHDAFKVPFPWVWPRPEATMFSVPLLRHARKLGRELEDVLFRLESRDLDPPPDSPDLERGRQLREAFRGWSDRLAPAFRRKTEQLDRAWDGLLRALEESTRLGSAADLARWAALRSALRPRSQPQERVLGLLPELLRSGAPLVALLSQFPLNALHHHSIFCLSDH